MGWQHTIVRCILQTRICNETYRCMETLRISQTIHNHIDFLTSQLVLDALQRAFQTEPEIDFLRCSTRSNIAVEFCYRLDGFDPGIHVSMKSIQETAICE